MTSVDTLDTPAVTILLDRLEANIARVQAHVTGHGMANRPHIKTHKIPQIGALQMAAGAAGLTCQKLGEVEAFVDAGVCDDILLSFNIVGAAKTDRLMALAERVDRLAVVADNEAVIEGLSAAGRRHGRDVPLLVELDAGFGRNGATTPEAARDLARFAASQPHIRFEGVMIYPNQVPGTAEFVARTLELLAAERIDVPVVSGGSTPSLPIIERFPMMTEHRAGTYVYNDVMMMQSGAAEWDDCAMHVRATVVSTPTADRAVVDAGSKTLTREQFYVEHFGRVVEYPDAVVANLSEEHGVIDVSKCAAKPRVGEVVSLIPQPLLRRLQHGRRSLWRARRRRGAHLAGRRPRREPVGGALRSVVAYLRFRGGIRSVMVPSNISAAKATVSDSVGCGWMVRLTSSASAPISMASPTSAIRSPALTPTIPAPSTCFVSGSNSSLVIPSDRSSASARPDAAHGNTPLPTSISSALASFSVSPTQAISGSV